MAKKLQSPGTFLMQLLEKYNLNPFKLSKEIKLSQSAVRLITIGKTKISVPVAMRLGKYFGNTPESWLQMQLKWDIAEAGKDKALTKIVKSITKVKKSTNAGKKPAAKKPAAKRTTAKKKTVAAKKPAAAKKKAVKARGRPAKAKPAARRGRKPAK
jgi:addiction module HigA family antidote